jgi:murein DD-endopeptidase MepM/ murein hydrolase activator NlpD
MRAHKIFVLIALLGLTASYGGQTASAQDTMSSSDLIYPTGAYRISSPFGAWTSWAGQRKEQHKAVDIHAPSGTSVYASAAGQILSVYLHRKYGRSVSILATIDGRDLVIVYAHLGSYSGNIIENAQIEDGQLIGEIGCTGTRCQSDNHLHYEIYDAKDKTFLDPTEYLFGSKTKTVECVDPSKTNPADTPAINKQSGKSALRYPVECSKVLITG